MCCLDCCCFIVGCFWIVFIMKWLFEFVPPLSPNVFPWGCFYVVALLSKQSRSYLGKMQPGGHCGASKPSVWTKVCLWGSLRGFKAKCLGKSWPLGWRRRRLVGMRHYYEYTHDTNYQSDAIASFNVYLESKMLLTMVSVYSIAQFSFYLKYYLGCGGSPPRATFASVCIYIYIYI